MDILISVRDIANFIIYSLGAAALIVLIIALVYVIRFVKRLDKLVEKNTDYINKTASLLPEVVDNINDVSVSVKDGINKAEQTVETIEEYICETVTTVSDTTEGLFDFISVAGEVVKTIVGLFPVGKKK
ncbi:hypothetical protein [Acetivibrio cellulolyticus]|uniref:hypothetical protein n=1 Tax=Acetivibrio cellulolyticus TaxID=35830 RepID=UPI0001E2E764|nr:hypothetical protein [Acetivibrio cellulolyticus]